MQSFKIMVLKLSAGLLWQVGGLTKFVSRAPSLTHINHSRRILTHNLGGVNGKTHVFHIRLPCCTTNIRRQSSIVTGQQRPVASPGETSTSPFMDVVGHKLPVNILLEALRSQRIVQTYIFHGPSGVGKMLVAQRFAAALMGRKLGDHQVADFYCQSGFLGVDEARRLISFLGKSAWVSRKVVVIRAEGMTEEAANALLLTLEERPGTSVVIILAEDMNRLPKTLVSRCLRVPFRPLSPSETHQVLSRLPPSLSPIHAVGVPPHMGEKGHMSGEGSHGETRGEDRLLRELAEVVVEIGRGRPGMVVDAWEELRKLPKDVLSVLETLPTEAGALSTAGVITDSCNKGKQRWLLLTMMYWKLGLLDSAALGLLSSEGRLPDKYFDNALKRLEVLEETMRDLNAVSQRDKLREQSLWETTLKALGGLPSVTLQPS